MLAKAALRAPDVQFQDSIALATVLAQDHEPVEREQTPLALLKGKPLHIVILLKAEYQGYYQFLTQYTTIGNPRIAQRLASDLQLVNRCMYRAGQTAKQDPNVKARARKSLHSS